MKSFSKPKEKNSFITFLQAQPDIYHIIQIHNITEKIFILHG